MDSIFFQPQKSRIVNGEWEKLQSISNFDLSKNCKRSSSWHRVQEVLGDSPRLSINGWFHSTHKLPIVKLQPKKLEFGKAIKNVSFQESFRSKNTNFQLFDNSKQELLFQILLYSGHGFASDFGQRYSGWN